MSILKNVDFSGKLHQRCGVGGSQVGWLCVERLPVLLQSRCLPTGLQQDRANSEPRNIATQRLRWVMPKSDEMKCNP